MGGEEDIAAGGMEGSWAFSENLGLLKGLYTTH